MFPRNGWVQVDQGPVKTRTHSRAIPAHPIRIGGLDHIRKELQAMLTPHRRSRGILLLAALSLIFGALTAVPIDAQQAPDYARMLKGLRWRSIGPYRGGRST